MFPAVILALVLPALRDTRTLRAALAGSALALAVTPLLPVGLPVLLALPGVVLAVERVRGRKVRGKNAQGESTQGT